MDEPSLHLRLALLIQQYLEGALDEEGTDELLAILESQGETEDRVTAGIRHNLWTHFLLNQHYIAQKKEIEWNSSEEIVFSNETSFENPVFDIQNLPLQSIGLPLTNKESANEAPAAWHPAVTPSIRAASRHESKNEIRLRRLIFLLLPILFFWGVYAEFRQMFKTASDLSPPIGKVTGSVDAGFPGDHFAFKRGQRLFEGETIVLASGKLELELKNNIRVILEGPATYSLETAMKTSCKEGRVSVEILSPEGRGFEIKTPFMTVRDLGTEFALDVSAKESTVHVVKGLVEVSRSGKTAAEINEGQGMVYRSKNVALPVSAETGLYVTREQWAKDLRDYDRRKTDEWKELYFSWRKKHGLRCQLGFLDIDSEPSKIGKVFGATDVERTGCRDVDGRWTEKNAVHFASPDDRIRFSTSCRTRSFTLVASVSLEKLRGAGILFATKSPDAGEVYWQIEETGKIQLFVREKSDREFVNYQSPVVFTPKNFDTWVTLATTVDAEKGTVTHYFDGKAVGSMPLEAKIDIDFSEATLGNFPLNVRRTHQTHFNGRIDEFILWDRAISSEMIGLFSGVIH